MADWYFRNSQSGLKACPGCRNLVRTNEEFCPYCARRLREEGGVRGLYKNLLKTPFVATRFLTGTIAVVFLLQMLANMFLPAQYRLSSGGGGLFGLLTADALTYIRMGSNFHPMVYALGEYWRFLTSCFLHFGILHILFNCWAFRDLGRLAERIWGPKQVFATFILSGVAGSFASFLVHMYVTHPANSAGASGAICGILGLLLGAYYRNKYQIGEFLGSQLVRWAVYIIIFGLVMGADNAAHVGGMLAGGALGYFMRPTAQTKTPDRDEKIWNAAAIASLVIMLVGFGCAIAFFARGPEYAYALLR